MVFFKMSKQNHKESKREKEKRSTIETETHRRESPFDENRYISAAMLTARQLDMDMLLISSYSQCGSKQAIFKTFDVILEANSCPQ